MLQFSSKAIKIDNPQEVIRFNCGDRSPQEVGQIWDYCALSVLSLAERGIFGLTASHFKNEISFIPHLLASLLLMGDSVDDLKVLILNIQQTDIIRSSDKEIEFRKCNIITVLNFNEFILYMKKKGFNKWRNFHYTNNMSIAVQDIKKRYLLKLDINNPNLYDSFIELFCSIRSIIEVELENKI